MAPLLVSSGSNHCETWVNEIGDIRFLELHIKAEYFLNKYIFIDLFKCRCLQYLGFDLVGVTGGCTDRGTEEETGGSQDGTPAAAGWLQETEGCGDVDGGRLQKCCYQRSGRRGGAEPALREEESKRWSFCPSADISKRKRLLPFKVNLFNLCKLKWQIRSLRSRCVYCSYVM